MISESPKFIIKDAAGNAFQSADVAVENIQTRLRELGWVDGDGEVGTAIVKLFGRLVELQLNRLNASPDKHLLAFLNEAGVSRLPPRSATTEVSFSADPGGPNFIRVPKGTQLATAKSETQEEIVFETEKDIVVAPLSLKTCVAFDSMNYNDNTGIATGSSSGSFAAFKGKKERSRTLYIGDKQLLAFDDDVLRRGATITLNLTLSTPAEAAADGGWTLTWKYWDDEEEEWDDLTMAGATVDDHTNGFGVNGNVEIRNLPLFAEAEVDGESALWLACELSGGSARNKLPVFSNISMTRSLSITPAWASADAVMSVTQASTIVVAADPAKEFFPFGQRPMRLDTLYIQSDAAFTKEGATAKLDFALEGLPSTIANSSEIDQLKIDWEYYSADGWQPLGSSNKDGPINVEDGGLNFTDATKAFTATAATAIVSFTVPDGSGKAARFAKTTVADEEGYWVRARLVDGSYDEPGGMVDLTGSGKQWVAPKTHASLIKTLKLQYVGYTTGDVTISPVTYCRSEVDKIWRDHADGREFAPFSSADEGPALYLGFDKAFPAGEWSQLLIDVLAQADAETSATVLSWQYWNGDWAPLRVSDGTRGLTERGYLGFFAPTDHRLSKAFGTDAYWLRIGAHRAPIAYAGEDPEDLTADDDAVTLQLDASGSRVFDRQSISKYTWRIVSSSTAPSAATWATQLEYASDGVSAQVTLDGSASSTYGGRSIAKYIWRRAGEVESPETLSVQMPYVRVIRTNTIPVRNAISVNDEVLGSSDDKPKQQFQLLRPPIAPGAQIVVAEPDRPPSEELGQLLKELRETESEAEALPQLESSATAGQGVWVRWHQVKDFFASTPASRHFVLDEISGELHFGDGERGKIPPLGQNNIRALRYATHDGKQGNVAASSISVLRNPAGDLANIKVVTNPEPSVGGSDEETVDEVRRRGPQSLKHRGRAVTYEDFEWIAREASGEIYQARCLPTRNAQGLVQPGWVTVVITPRSSQPRPTPSLALIRKVRKHLEAHGLANLKSARQIHVKGPDYIEATVLANVVPKNPEKSDEIELAILDRLETFLHPLKGGPVNDGGIQGWTLARDVFISEVYTEIESVEGVDYVHSLSLQASLQQYRIHLRSKLVVPADVPVGSRVSSFDERIKLLLAESLSGEGADTSSQSVQAVSAYGFKAGDIVTIVANDNSLVERKLKIASVLGEVVMFSVPVVPPALWEQSDALMSADGQLRLPFDYGQALWNESQDKILGVRCQGFVKGDKLCIGSGAQRDPRLEFLQIAEVGPAMDRIYVPEGHLIYSGRHDIEMVLS